MVNRDHKTNDMTKAYKNSDFYRTAFCLAHGIRLLRVERPYEGSKRCLFVLEEDGQLADLLDQFDHGETAPVCAKRFVEAQKHLKGQIFDSKYY